MLAESSILLPKLGHRIAGLRCWGTARIMKLAGRSGDRCSDF